MYRACSSRCSFLLNGFIRTGPIALAPNSPVFLNAVADGTALRGLLRPIIQAVNKADGHVRR
jgi:hypothetical protein